MPQVALSDTTTHHPPQLGLVCDGRRGWTFIRALLLMVMAALSAVPYFPPQKAGFGATESSMIAWSVPIALESPFHISGD